MFVPSSADLEPSSESMMISSLNQVKKGGEEIINLSFWRGMLLILFAATTLLVAQILFVYFKKKMLRDI